MSDIHGSDRTHTHTHAHTRTLTLSTVCSSGPSLVGTSRIATPDNQPNTTKNPRNPYLRPPIVCARAQVGIIDFARFDLESYEYYDHPAVADLHEIVPKRFVAFKGPKSKRRHFESYCELTPTDYIEIFENCERKSPVTALVEGQGFRVLNLEIVSAKSQKAQHAIDQMVRIFSMRIRAHARSFKPCYSKHIVNHSLDPRPWTLVPQPEVSHQSLISSHRIRLALIQKKQRKTFTSILAPRCGE